MKKHFVQIEVFWVNPWQVCYLRSMADGSTAIGFHGGEVYDDGLTNEIYVSVPAKEVAAKLEEAMREEVFVVEGGAE